MIESLLIDNIENFKDDNNDRNEGIDVKFMPKVSVSNIIISLVISLSAAYFAYMCNLHETPATRMIYVIIAFLFPGLYLIYFFIRYVVLGYKCGDKMALKNMFKRK